MKTFKELQEALDLKARLARKRAFMRNKTKIKIGRERAMKRKASVDVLKKRAQKQARHEVEKKLLNGKDKSELSMSARQALEKRVDKKKGAIEKLARKLLPALKKKEYQK